MNLHIAILVAALGFLAAINTSAIPTNKSRVNGTHIRSAPLLGPDLRSRFLFGSLFGGSSWGSGYGGGGYYPQNTRPGVGGGGMMGPDYGYYEEPEEICQEEYSYWYGQYYEVCYPVYYDNAYWKR